MRRGMGGQRLRRPGAVDRDRGVDAFKHLAMRVDMPRQFALGVFQVGAVDRETDRAAVADRRLGQLQEPALAADHHGELGLEDFQGHAPIVPDIAREEDRRHATGADLALNLVAAAERGAQLDDHVHSRPGPGRRATAVRGAESDARKRIVPWG